MAAVSENQDLASWESQELSVSDRPELTSAIIVVSGGKLYNVFKSH